MADSWAEGDRYEPYIGRWSRQVAPLFVDWLAVPPGRRWVDLGCGTGALTAAVLRAAAPDSVVGYDPSADFVVWAGRSTTDTRARFEQGDVSAIPAASADVVVSGLVVNFVPDPVATVAAMASAAPGGTVAAYVWDYAEGMELIRRFWDVAVALDPAAGVLDEARRFPLCRPEALATAWALAGLGEIETTALEVTTDFVDFDDLWNPFLGGTGPAPGYVASLEPAAREGLREALREALASDENGTIRLTARAYAVRGTASTS
jgi:SAM-dependent methyltransferase